MITPEAIAGLGARPAAQAADILALIRRAEALSGHRVTRLAAPEFRRGLAALEDAAAVLGTPLVYVTHQAILAAQPRCPTRSDAALRATGLASVAEGCALASGGALILPRIGGPGITCALSAWTVSA
ncbi:cobalamin biosynthesis protein [Pseudoroseomonas globiformis]|uniref:Cobalamin biosynthesis protein n=1 Tax=Teichococcus globiformis TaxID=2307229 RepID=A0ABV7FWE0_9PROT